MEIHLQIIGVALLVLAAVHVTFPRYFNWKVELQSLSLMNRQMMIIHTFFIALVVLLMGLLCLNFSADLVATKLGKTVSLGFAIFWTIRLFIQFFGYSPDLWKGKRFETSVHIIFSCFWLYLSVVFWLVYIG